MRTLMVTMKRVRSPRIGPGGGLRGLGRLRRTGRFESTFMVLGSALLLVGLSLISEVRVPMRMQKLTERRAPSGVEAPVTEPSKARSETATQSGTVAGSSTVQSAKPPALPVAPNGTAACRALTPAIAQQILGAGTQPATSPSEVSTADMDVSSCVYTNSTATETVSLTAHIALTNLGASENAVVFGSDKPLNAVSLPGLGQVAYWSPDMLQLNMLENNNWYVISRTKNASSASLDEVEAVARLVAEEVSHAF